MSSSTPYYNFQSFDALNYLTEEDHNSIIDLIANYITTKARGENRKFSFDEIIKVLNTIWWKKEIKDAIVQKIWTGTNKL
jgi:hypothetical protein